MSSRGKKKANEGVKEGLRASTEPKKRESAPQQYNK